MNIVGCDRLELPRFCGHLDKPQNGAEGVHRWERDDAKTKGRYGTPRVERALRHQGVGTSRRRVARLRRELGLKAKAAKKFKVTTDSTHGHPVAPNRLQRCFVASATDRVWVGDITYLWTREGWLYLAIVLDTYSRRIVGWSVSERLERDLAVTALEKALAARRPGPGLLHHTD